MFSYIVEFWCLLSYVQAIPAPFQYIEPKLALIAGRPGQKPFAISNIERKLSAHADIKPAKKQKPIERSVLTNTIDFDHLKLANHRFDIENPSVYKPIGTFLVDKPYSAEQLYPGRMYPKAQLYPVGLNIPIVQRHPSPILVNPPYFPEEKAAVKTIESTDKQFIPKQNTIKKDWEAHDPEIAQYRGRSEYHEKKSFHYYDY